MKRIFYRLNNELYLDYDAMISMASYLGFGPSARQAVSLTLQRKRTPEVSEGLIHIN